MVESVRMVIKTKQIKRIKTQLSADTRMTGWPVPPPYVANLYLRRKYAEKSLFDNWKPPTKDDPNNHENQIRWFKQMHFCARQMKKIYKRMHERFDARQRVKYDEWFHKYSILRNHLTEANVGLVYTIMAKHHLDGDVDEQRSEGLFALLRAIDAFNPWKGFRFSTYSCNAIIRAMYRLRRRKVHISVEWNEDQENMLAERSRPVCSSDQTALKLEVLDFAWTGNTCELTPIEVDVIKSRFLTDDKRETLGQIGDRIGKCNEWVRQTQERALDKLRKAVEKVAI